MRQRDMDMPLSTVDRGFFRFRRKRERSETVSIKVTCPSCQKTINAPDSAAGKRGKCPGCQTIISIPAAAPEPTLEIVEEPSFLGKTHVKTNNDAVSSQPAVSTWTQIAEISQYLKNNLAPGEKIIGTATISDKPVRCVRTMSWIVGVVAIIVGIAVGIGSGIAVAGILVFLVLIAMPLLLLAIREAYYRTTEVAVTDRRIVVKTGWLSTKVVEIDLSKLESVVVDQGIIGRYLNFGTISMQGTGNISAIIDEIDDPVTFRMKLLEAQAATKK